jgi:AcrR family transcriptional regulator
VKFDLTKYEIKKDNILNATYKCIYELGVSGISMRSIAKEAGVNQPMLHYYFKNRENLLTESLRALFDRFTADITKGYKASDPPEKKLDALLEAGKDHIVKEREMFIAFAEVWSLAIKKPAMQSIFANLYKEFYAIIEDILDEGIQKGVFRDDVREDTLPVLFMAFIEGFGLLWHMREDAIDLEEQFEFFSRNLKRKIIRKKKSKKSS